MKGSGRVYRPVGKLVWMLAYYIGPPDARRLIRESSKTRDEKLARTRLATKLRQAANAQDGISEFEEPTHRRVTIDTLFDELLADYRRREIKGLGHVEIRLKAEKSLRKVFGHRRASSVTTADITRYMNDRKQAGFANATVNREIELLRRALRLGIESRRIVRMPMIPKRLTEKNARQGFFETGDLVKILEHLPEPLGDMARFAFATGWRRGMLLGMRWSDVDRTGRVVTLPDSKNDDPQSVPLEAELLEVIERRWSARSYFARGVSGVSEYVFHRKGRPISKPTFNREFAIARAAAGISSGRIFHDFRRTAARNMIRGGVPQSIAMRVTGHRSDSMFRRYDITSMDDKLEALRKASAYAKTRIAVGENVSQFPATRTPTDTPAGILGVSSGNWLGGRESNPD